MTDRQSNILNMYLATNSILGRHNQWENVPALMAAVAGFRDTIRQIQEARQLQETEITGVTADKNAVEKALADAATKIAAVISVLATITNDNALKGRVDYSHTDIWRAKDTETLSRAQIIYDEAAPRADDLEAYGLQGAEIIALSELIDQYETLIAEPRAALAEKTQATNSLQELIDDAHTLLREQIDKLMIVFKATAPPFYNAYFSARTIVDLGRGGSREVTETLEQPEAS